MTPISASGKVGSVGFCLGGRLAYLTSTRTKADAAVGYYGVYLTEHLDDIAPKRLILTHMSEDMLERVQSLDFETAEDGKIIEI